MKTEYVVRAATAMAIGTTSFLSPIDVRAADLRTTPALNSESPSSAEANTQTETTTVPVFYNETELKVTFPPLYIIRSETNLREDPSVDSDIIMKLQEGYVVSESEAPSVNDKGENWYTATVEYDGTSVVTDTISGHLREDVRGIELSEEQIPDPLKQKYNDIARKENTPPISFSGEFSLTTVLNEFQNTGGNAKTNDFIAELFNEPALVTDDNGNDITYFERAASGKDVKATLDFTTGKQVYKEYLLQTSGDQNDTTQFDFPQIWTNVMLDKDKALHSWQAVPFRMQAQKADGTIIELFYYRNGIQGENNDQNNALLTYQDLKGIIGADAAQIAARDAFVLPGFSIRENQVIAENPDSTMQALLADVDTLFIEGIGLVSIPGNQELEGQLEDGQEIGTILYRDQAIIVTDTEGNEALKLVPSKTASGEVEWKKVEESVVYDNEYLANLLKTKKMEEFDEGPLDFESYISTVDTQLLIPVGGNNGFSEQTAQLIKDIYDLLYVQSPTFKDFMENNPRFRALENFDYPPDRDNILSSPNYLRGYLLEEGQEVTSQEAKATYGYIYVMKIEHTKLEDWANRIQGNYDEVLQGLWISSLVHEGMRIYHGGQFNASEIKVNDPKQFEIIEKIIDEINLSPGVLAGLNEGTIDLQNQMTSAD